MIVALTGQKGGVGKSTTAIALASEAVVRGLSVALVDADPQRTAATWHDVAHAAGRKTPQLKYPPKEPATLHKRLPALAREFELVVVDCPPRHDDVQRSALMVTDLAILPCGPSGADAWALSGSIEIVKLARKIRPQLRAAVLITRKQRRTASGKAARDVLVSGGLQVLATELTYRVAYQEAVTGGYAVTDFDRGDAALEVRRLLDEVLSFAPANERLGVSNAHP